MGEELKVSFNDHSLGRVKERIRLSPERILDMFSLGGVYEAHRKNGVSYFVLWSKSDKRPYVVIVKDGVIISCYYTYELHRRGDGCVILPVHISLSKKALSEYDEIKIRQRQLEAKYHLYASVRERTINGKIKRITKKLFSFPRKDFDSFQGTLLEFIRSKPEIIEAISKVDVWVAKGADICLELKKSGGWVVASLSL